MNKYFGVFMPPLPEYRKNSPAYFLITKTIQNEEWERVKK